MVKISLSGPVGCSFKWSGKFRLSIFISDSPPGNLHFTFLTILQIRKFLFLNKTIIILLYNSLWAERKEVNVIYTGAYIIPSIKTIKIHNRHVISPQE